MSRETATDQSLTPALNETQWADLMTPRGILVDGLHMRKDDERVTFSEGYEGVYITHDGMAAAIATLNAALPDSSRRKLNWDYVAKLQEIGEQLLGEPDRFDAEDPRQEYALRDAANGAALLALSQVLASYLPPKEGEEGKGND